MKNLIILFFALLFIGCASANLENGYDLGDSYDGLEDLFDSRRTIWVANRTSEFIPPDSTEFYYRGGYLICGQIYVYFRKDKRFCITLLNKPYELETFRKMQERGLQSSYGKPNFND